jgi:hypothetical protein
LVGSTVCGCVIEREVEKMAAGQRPIFYGSDDVKPMMREGTDDQLIRRVLGEKRAIGALLLFYQLISSRLPQITV